jgi:hypothetical protein
MDLVGGVEKREEKGKRKRWKAEGREERRKIERTWISLRALSGHTQTR